MTSCPPDTNEPIRVLLVDDDEMVRETLTNLLEEAGFQVIAANDGEMGLALHQEHAPTVVVTDILMPHKEGMETIMELRRRDPATQIIAMSGGDRTGGIDFLSMARRLGADRVLQKPFRIGELIAAIKELAG